MIQNHSIVQNATLEKAMIGNHVRYNGEYTTISIGDYSALE
jgi:glucose-1-phosphate thymidylyltransferase